jgi:hypothetical protein
MGVATEPVKFVVGALRRPVWAWKTGEPHCSRGVQPSGICVYVAQREPTPEVRGRACALCRGRKRLAVPIAAEARSPAVFTCTWYSASRPPEVRGRACAQAAGASYASCRSGSIYTAALVLYMPAAALVLYIYIYKRSGLRFRSLPLLRPQSPRIGFWRRGLRKLWALTEKKGKEARVLY